MQETMASKLESFEKSTSQVEVDLHASRASFGLFGVKIIELGTNIVKLQTNIVQLQTNFVELHTYYLTLIAK